MKFIVYVAILLVAAAGLALGLDLLTAPPKKLEANAARPASAAVRQIPIKEATALSNGDPNNQLTPIYPAAPGKDLPVKDTPVVEAAKPAPKALETDGNAPAATQANASTPAVAAVGACNIQACEAAYRSFRASDCSYQPFEGDRKFCDAGPTETGQAASTPAPTTQASEPPTRRESSAQRQKTQEQRDLDAAIRTVRSLPPPSTRDDGRDFVVEEPLYGERYGDPYGPRQRWIIERR